MPRLNGARAKRAVCYTLVHIVMVVSQMVWLVTMQALRVLSASGSGRERETKTQRMERKKIERERFIILEVLLCVFSPSYTQKCLPSDSA